MTLVSGSGGLGWAVPQFHGCLSMGPHSGIPLEGPRQFHSYVWCLEGCLGPTGAHPQSTRWGPFPHGSQTSCVEAWGSHTEGSKERWQWRGFLWRGPKCHLASFLPHSAGDRPATRTETPHCYKHVHGRFIVSIFAKYHLPPEGREKPTVNNEHGEN